MPLHSPPWRCLPWWCFQNKCNPSATALDSGKESYQNVGFFITELSPEQNLIGVQVQDKEPKIEKENPESSVESFIFKNKQTCGQGQGDDMICGSCTIFLWRWGGQISSGPKTTEIWMETNHDVGLACDYLEIINTELSELGADSASMELYLRNQNKLIKNLTELGSKVKFI